jgi:hypothetical protein
VSYTCKDSCEEWMRYTFMEKWKITFLYVFHLRT